MTRHFHRRNLPHLYYDDGIYFITFRLANTIPLRVLKELQAGRNINLTKEELSLQEKRIFKKYNELLDSAHYGHAYLVKDEIAKIVKDALHYPDGKDYVLICYCIMLNHVHLVFELTEINKGISKIMQSIKRTSARQCNKLLNQEGKFWQDENFDRLVRDEREFRNIINYVVNNPVKAGLVKDWEKWKHTYFAENYQYLYNPVSTDY